MCAFPQLVSAPLNPIPVAEHFRTLYVRRRHIPGIASMTFCQVTDFNFPQLIACFLLNFSVRALMINSTTRLGKNKRKTYE